MGEIAEAMLDGTLCQTCGEYLDDGAPGHPRYCDACRPEGVTHVIDLMEALKRSLAKPPEAPNAD